MGDIEVVFDPRLLCRERGLRLDVVELGEVESHRKPAVAFVAETPTRGGSSL